MLESGIDLASALETTPSRGRQSRDVAAMAARLRRGDSFDMVLREAPAWLPVTDRFLLSSAAASGRLPEACAHLRDEHEDRAEHRRALWLAALYPLVILQGAAFLLSLAWSVSLGCEGNFTFDTERFVGLVALLSGGAWTLVLLLSVGGGRFPRVRERALRWLPGFGSYWRHRCLARFASSLDALLEAGTRYAEAAGGAALTVHDTRLTPAILRVLPQLEGGQPLSQVLPSLRAVPRDFRQQFTVAEQTGRLHQALPRMAETHRQAAKRALFQTAFWYPKLLFLAAAIAVALSVASLYGAYLDFILQMAE